MVDARFDPVPTAHVSADLSADYADVTGAFESVPTAHIIAEFSTNEPGP